MTDDRRTTPERAAPLPGSPDAHAQGCTCPDPGETPPSVERIAAPPGGQPGGRAFDIDENCPVHGRAAIAWDRAGERGAIDTEGDIVDSAGEAELRRNR